MFMITDERLMLWTLWAAPCAELSWVTTHRLKSPLGELTAAKSSGDKDHSPLERVSCLHGGWKWSKSLTEWELLCRVASTPGSAVHVCSFSPALRFESSVLSELSRSSSLPSSLCSLLRADIFSSSGKCAPSAQLNNPSAKMQDTVLMFTNNKKRLPNFELGEQLSSPHTSGLHMPPSSPQRIFNDGPPTAARDWSRRE